MSRLHHKHQVLHVEDRTAKRALERGAMDLEHSTDRTPRQVVDIWKRSPSSSASTSAPTCNEKDNNAGCHMPTSSNITLPVALGILIPLTFAVILMLFLHRRHVRKLRNEDANDKYKSLDFGMDPSDAAMTGKRNKKGALPATMIDLETEKALRRGRGISMDMGNPYILPPDLQSSRESIHSLSRTIHGGDDRYRPATTFFANDSSMPLYTNPRRGGDDSSSYTGSSGRGYRQDGMNQNLLHNAQRMSRSLPPNQRNSEGSSSGSPQIRAPEPALIPSHNELPSNPRDAALVPGSPSDSRESYNGKEGADLRRSNNYLGAFIHSREPSTEVESKSPPSNRRSPPTLLTVQEPSIKVTPPPVINAPSTLLPPPRKQSLQAQTQPIYYEDTPNYENDYGNALKITPPSPSQEPESNFLDDHRRSRNFSMSAIEEIPPGGLEAPDLGLDPRRLSMGFRPLPREEPSDNPEQRANRIRSFYKEYFDESKPTPAVYYEDYGQEFLGDGTVFDPASGQFVVAQAPYSEPITRRAMTPPPRTPPRMQNPGRVSNTSNPQYMMPGPRAFSSVSGRFGPANRALPRTVLPPPGPLRTLPTPHLLQEDAFALPIDFAPPQTYKDRQAGRSASPISQRRAYSPALPVHNPLVSSFDDLSVMPSPHLLRKSGTFTALDFAPPPRFKNSDSGSDAGSIRSGRSNGSAMSAAQIQNIRAGAYRVSRIPKEVVGTRNELADSLKPTWNLRPHDI